MFTKLKLLKFISIVCLNMLFFISAPAHAELKSAVVPVNSLSKSQSFEHYHFPFMPGPLNSANMLVPSPYTQGNAQTYILPATPETTQWGYFDNSQAPVLHINSGDTVVIETMAASDNQVVPGVTVDQVAKLNNAVPGRGPHTVTGPIYVNGALPGDILKIHFNKIVPRSYASNNSLPGRGLLPQEFPQGQIKYFYLDVNKKQMQFAPGIIVPLRPFPGVIAVARAESGKYDTAPPGPFGGNLDLREMTEGTTLYLPVFVKGALLWTGDSHAGQGNGEINLTAIETAFQEFNVTVHVIKQQTPLTWPRVKTPTAWITMGYDQNLNKALDILKAETVKFIMQQRKVTSVQAEKIMLSIWNCPIAEVVNGVKGVYCILPNKAEEVKIAALPTKDNSQFFVTYAKNADIEKAMSMASMAMINKIVTTKKLSPLDAYSLASITMDCRIAPYTSGDKEVHCMLAKKLWSSSAKS